MRARRRLQSKKDTATEPVAALSRGNDVISDNENRDYQVSSSSNRSLAVFNKLLYRLPYSTAFVSWWLPRSAWLLVWTARPRLSIARPSLSIARSTLSTARPTLSTVRPTLSNALRTRWKLMRRRMSS